MTLQQLRYVSEIARCGSFSAASQSLFISQPSLSNAVKELERELGISIFERTNRGIKLSSDGSELVKYAASLIEQADDLLMRFSGEEQVSGTTFSVSSQHYSFVSDAFVRLISEQSLGSYHLTLREGRTLEIIDDVHHHKSEIGVLYVSNQSGRHLLRLISGKDLLFTSLKQVPAHVFIRPEHPLAKCTSISPQKLAQYPFVCYEQDDSGSLSFSEEVIVGGRHSKTIYVRDRATMENIIAKTDAYTIGTGYIIPSITGSGMYSIPLESDEMINIGYICSGGAILSPVGEQFINNLIYSLSKWAHI